MAKTIPQARTIDEVLLLLNEIIGETINEKSPMGYFAVLYCKVTEKVKEGITEGMFQNGPRMEKLDVIFANRYIKAYYEYKFGLQPSSCWQVAFEYASDFWMVVLQHLLLGMNAHINLDLSIAAAQVAPGNEIHDLQADFNMINHILSGLVGNVETAMSDVWPFLKWVLKKTKNVDTFLIDFSMQEARNGAWKYALELAPLDNVQFTQSILIRDNKITKIADLITNPGYIPSFIFKILRLFERGNVVEKIEKLRSVI
ncbi:hypothetical protein FIA58_007550 [Flavobacterium jejuense]|uniref:Uncharacterized protein n=1 Tax=Flavobacterium jejuense TaxID=1544455 RepID=A0ABX0INZ1_9FLAO|nr:DUF5995 family protein [Flavobacterium jejuense]NHN25529.1 hypothetical protein [Flavobacterium jejuense]